MKKSLFLFGLSFLLSSFTYVFAAQKDIVAYYPFDGNPNDESGNGNNGTVYGATLTTDRFGRPDHAYYFNGVNNYISIPDNSNLNIGVGESFSVSFWIRHDNVLNKGKYIISKYKGSFGEPSYAFGTGSYGDAYSWFEQTSNNGIENRGSIDLNDDKWHSIIVVFKSGVSISIYVDGALDVSKPTTHTGSILNSLDLTIGCGANHAQFYQGAIDDIKIFKKALSSKEINEQSHLVAYYPFDGDAIDASDFNNNGVVNGAVLAADRFGKADKSYYFDGVNDYILCDTEVGPFGNDSRTVTFWAKTDVNAHPSNQQNTVLSYGGNIYDGGSRFEILVNPKCSGVGVDLSSKYKTWGYDNSDNGWHHYAVVFNNTISYNLSDFKIYADGQLITSICNDNGGDIAVNTLNEQVLNIGRLFYADQPRYFRGSLDEIKIFDKALSEEEITDLYEEDISTSILDESTTKPQCVYYSKGVLYLKDHIQVKDFIIVNISGQTLFRRSNLSFPFNVDFLNNGLYIVKVKNEKGNIFITKFVK